MEYLIGLLIIGIIFACIYFTTKEIQENLREYKKWKKQKKHNSYYHLTKEKEYSFDFSYMPYKKANLLTSNFAFASSIP